MGWQSLFGVVALTALAWLLGEKRRMPPWRVIAAGLALQFTLALVLLFLPPVKAMFLVLNRAVAALQEATMAGTAFVFGYLGGAPLPYAETAPGASFVLAFQALPLVLVMSALSALFFYWRVLPLVVRGFAWALEKSLGIGGAVGVSAAANVFVGMVEAPLLVRPYLKAMSRGELFMVMTCGMASIAGTVMALYAAFLARVIPDAIGHLLIASLISAPAAVMVSQLMVPHEGPPTPGTLARSEDDARTAMDAITRGTVDGVGLLINIVAMLLVLVALVSLLNQALALLPAMGGMPIALERILGLAMAPVAWAMGIPWAEAQAAGHLLGIKTVLNELIAYLQLSRLPEGTLSERSALILTYALCGFANFGSLGIMIGGLGGMVPERRAEIVALGLKSLVSGTIATCLTGAVIGVLT